MDHATHQFHAATATQLHGLRPNDYQLTVIQEPVTGKAVVGNGKETQRKPIDPPPIIRLRISTLIDPQQHFVQSPYFFATCSLRGHGTTALTGTIVSSMHRMKLLNEDGAFFVFGDLHTKMDGRFELQFDLYEMHGDDCAHLAQVFSNEFTSYNHKTYPGMPESTALTQSFVEQGLKLRVRKAPRLALRTQGPAAEDYKPQHRGSISQMASSISPEAVQLRKGDQVEALGRQTYSSSQHSKQPRRSFSQGYGEPLPKRPRTGSEQSQFPSYGQSSMNMGVAQYSPQVMQADSQGSSTFITHPSSNHPQSYGYHPPLELQRGPYTSPTGVTQVESSAFSSPVSQITTQAFSSQTQVVRASPQEQYYQSPLLISQSHATQYDYNQYTGRPFAPSDGMASIGNEWPNNPSFAPQLSSPGELRGYSAYANTIPSTSTGSFSEPVTSAPYSGYNYDNV